MSLILRADPSTGFRIALFVVWAALTLWLASRHVMWRDEVRALTLAKRGVDLSAMISTMRGEGHPALWYVLLRIADDVFRTDIVLPTLAWAIGCATALIVAFRSPFRLPVTALILFGGFSVFEYTVMARNYGIGVLLMFVLTLAWPRRRRQAWVLAVTLFLLVNTSLPAAFIGASFMLFWAVEVLQEHGWRPSSDAVRWAAVAVVVLVALAVCFWTLAPPADHARIAQRAQSNGMKPLVKAIVEPGFNFRQLLDLASWPIPVIARAKLATALLLVSILGLVRSPGSMLAAGASLLGLSFIFGLIAPSLYRHECLWLVFLIVLFWIQREAGNPTAPLVALLLRPQQVAWAERAGRAGFVVLLLLQLPLTYNAVADAGWRHLPQSRSRDLAAFVDADPRLRDAVLLGDPDYAAEALPYYTRHRLYLVREWSYATAIDLKKVRKRVSLDEVTLAACTISTGLHVPAVVFLTAPLDRKPTRTVVVEGFTWEFAYDTPSTRRFRSIARFARRLAPARGDETYDVYVVWPGSTDAGCRDILARSPASGAAEPLRRSIAPSS